MVFYFTGTGNCLYIAKQLEAQPVSIPQVIHQENLHFCDKSIGIVAPVYGHEVPVMVKEFLHRATFDTDYFYMILTYGNRHGGAAGAGGAAVQGVRRSGGLHQRPADGRQLAAQLRHGRAAKNR